MADSPSILNHAFSPMSPSVSRLESLIQLLLPDADADATAKSSTIELAERYSEYLQEIRLILVDSSRKLGRVKDEFRRSGGFEACLTVVDTSSALLSSPTAPKSDAFRALFQTLKCVFAVLTEALLDHVGNRDYFALHRGTNSWSVLEQSLTGFCLAPFDSSRISTAVQSKLFGLLFAFALREEDSPAVFKHWRSDAVFSLADGSDAPLESAATTSHAALPIEDRLSTATRDASPLWMPEAVAVIVALWSSFCSNHTVSSTSDWPSISAAVLSGVYGICSHSDFNAVSAHAALNMNPFLERWLDPTMLPATDATCVDALTRCLLKFGVKSRTDAKYMFSAAQKSTGAQQALLGAIQSSRQPPHFVFDLSLHGFASIEFAALRSDFPPPEPARGYTFAAWLHVSSFDLNCHTTICGAFDETQTCFFLLYLEKSSRQLVLQTSTTSSRPSVRFRSVTFEQDRWYHVALVHHRPRPDGSSRAFLFVDGEFCEQVKASFPDSPPSVQKSRSTIPPRAGADAPRVQAFFGTPRDLSPRLGTSMLHSQWNLAGAQLFGEALPDELIFVYKHLGPEYQGNFRDSLGSFQTYRASAILNIQNEALHPSSEDHSMIARAVKGSAASLVSENSLLLCISAQRVIGADAAYDPAKYGLNNVSARVMDHLQRRLRSGGLGKLAVNQAIPYYLEALSEVPGTGILTGGLTFSRSGNLDDWSWRLSGCVPLALQSLLSADTDEKLVLGLDTCLELIRESWRNSEAFERENGFALLAWIIRSKLISRQNTILDPSSPKPVETSSEPLSLRVLKTILDFIGYDSQNAEKSVINNPLAFRSLLLDTDIWRTADTPTQELYYQQFVVFASASRHHDFNLKRLSRMRAAKKILDSLKGAAIRVDASQYLLDAFKVLFSTMPSTELYRSMALYITFSTAPASLSQNASQRTQSADALRKRQSTLSLRNVGLHEGHADIRTPSKLVSQEDLGVMVLRVFSDVLLREDSGMHLNRFAKTVTNRWLLYLLMTRREDIVVPTMSIIGKLLTTQPQSYAAKFETSSSGFTILKKALKRWWWSSKIWKACIALLLGTTVQHIDLDKPLHASAMIDQLLKRGKPTVALPSMLPVMLSILEYGFLKLGSNTKNNPSAKGDETSMSAPPRDAQRDILTEVALFLRLADLHVDGLRAVETSMHFVRDSMRALNATLTPADEDEYLSDLNHVHDLARLDEPRNAHESLTPLLHNIERRRGPQTENAPPNPRDFIRRRLSSFVLIRSDGSDVTEHQAEPGRRRASSKASLTILSKSGITMLEDGAPAQLVDTLISIFTDQILYDKDFTGLGLFMKAAPSPPKRRALLNSYLIARTAASIEELFGITPDVFREPRAILNVTKFIQQAYEALVEGWFMDGIQTVVSFCSRVLWHLQEGVLKDDKRVLLCTSSMRDIRMVLRKSTALQLYATSTSGATTHTLETMENTHGWRSSVVPLNEHDEAFCAPIICCLLIILTEGVQSESDRAVSLLKAMAVDDPEKLIPAVHTPKSDLTRLRYEFFTVLHESQDDLPQWIVAHQEPLVDLIRLSSNALLDPFIDHEVNGGAQLASTRSTRRRQRLDQWHLEDVSSTHMWTEFHVAAKHWTDNIHASETRRLVRMRQDQQEMSEYLQSQANGISAMLVRLGIADESAKRDEYSLDNIEGRDRMRLRLAPVTTEVDHSGYEPKRVKTMRKTTAQKASPQLSLDTSHAPSRSTLTPSPISSQDRTLRTSKSQNFRPSSAQIEDFEVVASPTADDEDEDKNRKVMRSLERGEQVKNVYNVSKIVGLEAYESLLIIGNNSLYIIGGLFQRSDGEVVSVRQAPSEERDKYTQIITGREMDSKSLQGVQADSKSHWLWSDILSVSKRQFLTRPVALEFFFADGRSFLMTALDSERRNKLHAEVIVRISDAKSKVQDDSNDSEWRMDLLKEREESTSRFSQVLAPMMSNPVTRRWIKGELSNFHYLMYVNTMAGRTFNDLTQYPVFPWVIADYTSAELDLSSPYTYRDLTRPMGCQKNERAAAFKERYASFAEMDDTTPAFHYGTHYSTAMIVTSFLIRLQPFVHSHVLLQGGSFDFADRLFFSIEKAWQSASSDTLSDVRELIPEFFYLPDFLRNVNGYEFGTREGSGEAVNDVQLPPWAKGDPSIFIAKNREALESPYVTQNLHSWIDLIFGFKQRGEAAIEAVNVFHYLSYPGAKDLDKIKDQHERAATIGIIHNFGQTPKQVFSRPHDRREGHGVKGSRVRKSIQSMAVLTTPVLERSQAIAELRYSRKLYSTCPRSVLVPPVFNLVMDWNYTDHSVRFISFESGKCLAIYEQLHQLPLSAAHFSDRKTLITASDDSSMSVWTVRIHNSRVDLQPRGSLFDHQAPVTILTSSKAFGTLLSASTDGKAYLWDLNRLELIRVIDCPQVVESARISDSTGHVLLCCGRRVMIFTLNGTRLIDQEICEEGDELTSCSFRSNATDSWTGAEVLYTGHKHGMVNVWELAATSTGDWVLARINQLGNDRRFGAPSGQRPPWITYVLPHEGKVFVGDRDGCAYEWNMTK